MLPWDLCGKGGMSICSAISRTELIRISGTDVLSEVANAFVLVRTLIDKTVLTPSGDGYDIELFGELAGFLGLWGSQNA